MAAIALMQATRLETLEECEEAIERGLGSFWEVGIALQVIKKNPDWIRRQYGTFDNYIQERWDFEGGRRYADYVIAATEVVKSLGTMVPNGNGRFVAPTTERQARPLAKLKTDEARIAVWRRVLDEAPLDKDGKPLVTSARVARAVEAWSRERRALKPEPKKRTVRVKVGRVRPGRVVAATSTVVAEPDAAETEPSEAVVDGGLLAGEADDVEEVSTDADDVDDAEEGASEFEPEPFLRIQVVPAQALKIAEAYDVPNWEALSPVERNWLIEHAPLERRATFNSTNDNVEWASWTWNPVTGCEHNCDYCYARDIANDTYKELPDGERFTPVFRPIRLHAPRHTRVPATYDPAHTKTIGQKNVFVCSMADLFGKWVPQQWIDAVFTEVVQAPEWNFLFLTKFPQRLAEQDWPANAWCGTTVDRQARVRTAERSFRGVKAGVKWLSCEPMLERLTFSDLSMFDWVVIGGASKSTQTSAFQPPTEWVEHLVWQARAAGCQVYFKTNLGYRPREYPTGAIIR